MRKIFIYTTIFTTLAFACDKTDNEPIQKSIEPDSEVVMTTEKVSANVDPSSKADINNTSGVFTWSVGDQLAVHVSDEKYYTTTALVSGGSNTAEFSVSYPEGQSRDAFAVYPASIVASDAANYGQSGHTLDVILPASYTLAQVSGTATPCPMIATNTPGNGWTFKQLCGLLRLTVNNIPSDATGLVIQFPGKKVNGSFSIASPVTPGTSTIETGVSADGEDKITVTFAAGTTSATVNIPLPTGTYDDVCISSKGSSSNKVVICHIKAGGYTAAAARAKKVTTTLTDLIQGSAITPSTSSIIALESIIKLSFKNGDTPIENIRFVRFFSEENKLQSEYIESNNKTSFGPVTVAQNTDLPNNPYIGLRFTSTANDPIVFQVIAADGKVYSGSINAPSSGFEKGKFYEVTVPVSLYTFTVASGKKVCFSPGDLGKAGDVYSFTTPFTDWGSDAKKNNYTGNRSWFDYGEIDQDNDPATSLYGITWRIETKVSSAYEWDYILSTRTMDEGVNRYYKLSVNGHSNCLLLPPDEATSADIESDIKKGSVGTDYVKYIAKGFVLLMNARRGSTNTSATGSISWSSTYCSYWCVFENGTNRKHLYWTSSAGPSVTWPTSQFRMHVRLVHDVE